MHFGVILDIGVFLCSVSCINVCVFCGLFICVDCFGVGFFGLLVSFASPFLGAFARQVWPVRFLRTGVYAFSSVSVRFSRFSLVWAGNWVWVALGAVLGVFWPWVGPLALLFCPFGSLVSVVALVVLSHSPDFCRGFLPLCCSVGGSPGKLGGVWGTSPGGRFCCAFWVTCDMSVFLSSFGLVGFSFVFRDCAPCFVWLSWCFRLFGRFLDFVPLPVVCVGVFCWAFVVGGFPGSFLPVRRGSCPCLACEFCRVMRLLGVVVFLSFCSCLGSRWVGF